MDYFHPTNWHDTDGGVIDRTMSAAISRYLDQTGYLLGVHCLSAVAADPYLSRLTIQRNFKCALRRRCGPVTNCRCGRCLTPNRNSSLCVQMRTVRSQSRAHTNTLDAITACLRPHLANSRPRVDLGYNLGY